MIEILAQTESPATEVQWRLQTHWTFAPWLTVLLVAIAIGLVLFCYAKERTPAGKWYRSLLGMLRLTSIALILIMLSELLLAGTRSGRPRLGWILDLSGSMTVIDAASSGDSPNSLSRWQLAQQSLLAEDAQLLRQASQKFDCQWLTTTGTERQLAGADAPAVVDQLVADQTADTPLGDCIAQLVTPVAQSPPQALAIVTDGRTTTGMSLASATQTARRVGVPLYFLAVGSDQTPPDIALSDPLADEVVFVDDLLSLSATLDLQGDIPGPVRLQLTQEGDSTVLAEQTLAASQAQPRQTIQLIHRPTTEGDRRYQIEAIPMQGERDVENNRVALEVQVRKAKVRVLLAAGYPMYEYRYLKNLLERDSTVQLTTYLQDADVQYSSTDQTATNRFPLRLAEFEPYDVVLLMDLDPRLLPRSAWPALAEHVSQGAGLALIAGPRYLPGSYRTLADFARLCPTKLETAALSVPQSRQPFQVTPTELGMRTSPFQLADSPAHSSTAWQAIAPVYWAADLGQPKPAAQVLANHPDQTREDGQPLPMVLTQYYGNGQVLLHAFDASYLWRKRIGDVYFARYWVQTLRRLAHGRLRRDDRGWELTVERSEYQQGEPVKLRLRTPGSAAEAATVLLQPAQGPQQRLELTPSPTRPGVLEADLIDLPVGRYRALLAGAAENAVKVNFAVVSPPGEFAKLAADTAAMKAAAKRTGGAYLPIQDALQLLTKLPAADRAPLQALPPVELWNRWWMLAGICTCLVSEWILRKQKAML